MSSLIKIIRGQRLERIQVIFPNTAVNLDAFGCAIFSWYHNVGFQGFQCWTQSWTHDRPISKFFMLVSHSQMVLDIKRSWR